MPRYVAPAVPVPSPFDITDAAIGDQVLVLATIVNFKVDVGVRVGLFYAGKDGAPLGPVGAEHIHGHFPLRQEPAIGDEVIFRRAVDYNAAAIRSHRGRLLAISRKAPYGGADTGRDRGWVLLTRRLDGEMWNAIIQKVVDINLEDLCLWTGAPESDPARLPEVG